jgi:hypothetical protein
MVVGGTGIVTLVYLIGNSYDYRLIFVTIPLMGLAKVLPTNSSLMVSSYVLILTILYFSFTSGPLALVGDLALAVFLMGLIHLTGLVLRRQLFE